MHCLVFTNNSFFSLEKVANMPTSPPRKLTSICVLGGSNLGNGNEYALAANKLGSLLAHKKIKLVYGGGRLGLIGNVALMAAYGGTRIIGIVLRTLKNILGNTIGEEIEVSSIFERIPRMLEHSDAFIALPGGLGAMEDILHVGSWLSMAIHSKPIGILNVNGFYDGLLSLLDHAVQEGFMAVPVRQIFIADSDPERLIEKLQAFEFQYASIGSKFDWFGNHSKKRKDDLDLRLSL